MFQGGGHPKSWSKGYLIPHYSLTQGVYLADPGQLWSAPDLALTYLSSLGGGQLCAPARGHAIGRGLREAHQGSRIGVWES